MTMGMIRITIKRRTKRVEGARITTLLHLAQTVQTLIAQILGVATEEVDTMVVMVVTTALIQEGDLVDGGE